MTTNLLLLVPLILPNELLKCYFKTKKLLLLLLFLLVINHINVSKLSKYNKLP